MRIALNAWFWDQPETGSGQYTRRLAENLTALDPSVEVIPIFPREETWAKSTLSRSSSPARPVAWGPTWPMSPTGPRHWHRPSPLW